MNLGPAALGLANSLSSFFNLVLLIYALRKKLRTLEMPGIVALLPRLALAGVIAGVIAYGGRQWWDNHFGYATLPLRMGEVFLPMIAATALYFVLGLCLRIPSTHEMFRMIRGQRPVHE